MTSRLEKAIRQLPPDKLEKLADYAESLVEPKDQPPRYLKLDWVGAAKGLAKEYASGVEAAHAATDMRIENIERKLKR